MDRYNELLELLKTKGIKHDEPDMYHDYPIYWLEITYIDSNGIKVNKSTQEYNSIEAAAVELLEYFKREY